MSYYVKASKIQGQGIFAKRDFQPNEMIEKIATKQNGLWIVNDYFGAWVNHSKLYRNTEVVLYKKEYWLKAIKYIFHHDEFTSDYTHRTTPHVFKRPDFPINEGEPKNNFRTRGIHYYKGLTKY